MLSALWLLDLHGWFQPLVPSHEESSASSFSLCKTRHTEKPVLSGHSKRRPKLVSKTNYRLMQVKSIAECSKRSILQYFRPSLSYHLYLSPLFCLFLSGCLRQVLLCGKRMTVLKKAIWGVWLLTCWVMLHFSVLCAFQLKLVEPWNVISNNLTFWHV